MFAPHAARFVIPLVLATIAGASSGAASEVGLWAAGSTTLRSVGRDFFVATTDGERPVALPASVRIEELFPLRGGAFLSALAPAESAAKPASENDLFLALLDERGAHPLPVPARAHQGFGARENAVPLASTSGELEGLVWLEGTDRQSYAVRHAVWDGLRWSEPETLAEPAAGSQLALAGATLGDGSRLLVWSRFDGHDDEIVAARFADGAWGPPQPIAPDNAVPDVTPAVIAVPGGALAAWSRYDGHDYRVVIARYDGRTWSAPIWAGPAGSTSPALAPAGKLGGASSRTAVEVWLTYATSPARGWAVVELDTAGRALRRGEVVAAPAARPVLAHAPTGELRLRWATRESAVELR